MTCHDFHTDLALAIESRDGQAVSRLAEHGEGCSHPDCRAAWRTEVLLGQAISDWRGHSSAPYVPLASRVLGDEAHPPRVATAVERSRPAAPRRWTSVTTVAALLVLVGLSLQPSNDSRRLAFGPRPTITTDRAAAGIARTDRRESYVQLANEATYFMTDLAMAVVPVNVDAVDGDPQSGWFSRLGERLEPVRDGVEVKLDEWFGPPMT